MAFPGRTHTFFITLPGVLSVSARVSKFSEAAEEIVQSEQEMVRIGEDTWALDWPVPETVELKTHVAIITADITSDISEEHSLPVEIEADLLTKRSALGSDRTLFGAYVDRDLREARNNTRRIVEEGIPEIPRIEARGIVVALDNKKITQGDTKDMSFTIFVEGTQLREDLTGATVRFRAAASVSGALAWDKICDIVDAVQGKCEVTLTPVDTATPGNYEAEVEVFFPDGSSITAERFTLNIREQIG